jgi:hypothetical protein
VFDVDKKLSKVGQKKFNRLYNFSPHNFMDIKEDFSFKQVRSFKEIKKSLNLNFHVDY